MFKVFVFGNHFLGPCRGLDGRDRCHPSQGTKSQLEKWRDRQTDRDSDRLRERETETETERERQRQTERDRERQRQTDRQTERAAGRYLRLTLEVRVLPCD